MSDQFDRLYAQLTELIPDLTELRPGDHRTSTAPGFMDLSLDVLTRSKEEMRIALSHYYRQEGDMIADPDMEIRVYLIEGWNKAEALTYQDARRYDEVYPEPGKVYPLLKKSLNSFLAQWLTNLKDQGHSLATHSRTSFKPDYEPVESVDGKLSKFTIGGEKKE